MGVIYKVGDIYKMGDIYKWGKFCKMGDKVCGITSAYLHLYHHQQRYTKDIPKTSFDKWVILKNG